MNEPLKVLLSKIKVQCSCSPTIVNAKGKISSEIKGLEVLQKVSIHSPYYQIKL